MTRLTGCDGGWNPLRPLPPVGGDPALYGVGLEGGRPYKLRLPLPGANPLLPQDMDAIAAWVKATQDGRDD